MGYTRGFIHGVAIGTVVGLCVAPQPGKRTREQLNSAADSARRTAKKAQQVAQTAVPYVQGAASTVKGQVDSVVRRHDDEETVNANGRTSTRANSPT